jgi:predicted aldo/keto reductase-like oxidoreductase
METRRFGRTGHMSTVAIFGAAAFWQISQADADAVMQVVLDYGVNHIDVAPSYGQGEERLGPFLRTERKNFFLGCKTYERNHETAWAEMNRSLERLQVDRFDLYQAHAVNTMEELDLVTRPGGSLEVLIKAREQGLTDFLGITGHGIHSPDVFLEALRRFDFDTVLFPINFIQFANPNFRQSASMLLQECRARDVGVMIIKSITREPWGDSHHTRNTWYRPFETPDDIQRAVNFVLSQDITGVCTAGDVGLLPLVLQACAQFTRQTPREQEELIASGGQYQPLFT